MKLKLDMVNNLYQSHTGQNLKWDFMIAKFILIT